MFVLYITVAVCCPCGVINDDNFLNNLAGRQTEKQTQVKTQFPFPAEVVVITAFVRHSTVVGPEIHV